LIGSEDLTLLGWDDGTSWDNLSHNTTDSFDTQSQRSSIDQK